MVLDAPPRLPLSFSTHKDFTSTTKKSSRFSEILLRVQIPYLCIHRDFLFQCQTTKIFLIFYPPSFNISESYFIPVRKCRLVHVDISVVSTILLEFYHARRKSCTSDYRIFHSTGYWSPCHGFTNAMIMERPVSIAFHCPTRR